MAAKKSTAPEVGRDVQRRYMAGGTLKARIIKKKGKGSQTTGKSKGLIPSQLARGMCRRNRSYKDARYAAVMASLGERKVKK